MIDFGKELDEMRENYLRKPMKKLNLPRETWAENDKIFKMMYIECDYLIHSGTICYAHIVQANTVLFSLWLPSNSAANLIYSTEEWVNRDPSVLGNVAHDLFSFKGKRFEEIPPNLRGIVSAITSEYDRSPYSFQISDQNGRPAIMNFNANVIFREYFPGFRLKGSIFPVFAAPDKCISVVVLPKKYWSKGFTDAWNNKQL